HSPHPTLFPYTTLFRSNNRTQMVRTAGPGHFEDRTISAACNPYLALAAYVAAGLDGIEKKLDPGEPNRRNMNERSPDEIRAQGIDRKSTRLNSSHLGIS